MNDIEHDLRELFHDRADRVAPAASPERTLRRARRRQLWTVALGAILALALVTGSLAGLRGLGTTPDEGGPASGSEGEAIASGAAGDLEWRLWAWVEGERVCTRIGWWTAEFAPRMFGTSPACGPPPALDRPAFSIVDTELDRSVLVAAIGSDVREVWVEAAPARFTTSDPGSAIVDAPDGWGDARLAVVVLEGIADGAVHFVGDDEDIVLPSVGVRWGEDGSLAFGRVPDHVTDEIASVEFGGTTSTLFAWREVATSKLCWYLRDDADPRRTVGTCSTVEHAERNPLLRVGPVACDRPGSVLWGVVPGSAEAVQGVGSQDLRRIDAIPAPAGFGDVRFVLAAIDRPYPGSVWIGYAGPGALAYVSDQDWISGTCIDRVPDPPEA